MMKDSCLLLPDSIKAYIAGTGSDQIKLSDIRKGFSLHATDSSYKITRFVVGYFDELKDDLYVYCSYEGNQFFISKYDQFEHHINGAKRLLIEKIKAIKGNACYYLRPVTCQVIK